MNHQVRLYSLDRTCVLRFICLHCNRTWPAGTKREQAEQERCPAKMEERKRWA